MSTSQSANKQSLVKSVWRALKTPSMRYSMGALLVVGFFSGIIFWGGFNTAMEMTNNEEFCISCHEMEDNVFQEYKDTIHYSNRTGVRATCPDCHVPKEWQHKVVRKIQASNELLHKALGTIDTREKFEGKRLQLARNVWRAMKETDSRECRNCHNMDSMDFGEQGRRAVKQHSEALDSGATCIDCHKGIAHELPDMHDVDPTIVIGSN
jgi:cytochrome c-type protein NapC